LHGARDEVGDGQHFRGEGRRDVARVAVEDANGKLTWTHESLLLLSCPMSMYESVITSAIP
jgi:hypothetical protein